MTNSRDSRQDRNRDKSRISDLRKCHADLADLATEEVVLVAELLAGGTMDMTQLVQHRALLCENQQQRKNKCNAKSRSIHSLAKYYALRLPQHVYKSGMIGDCAMPMRKPVAVNVMYGKSNHRSLVWLDRT